MNFSPFGNAFTARLPEPPVFTTHIWSHAVRSRLKPERNAGEIVAECDSIELSDLRRPLASNEIREPTQAHSKILAEGC